MNNSDDSTTMSQLNNAVVYVAKQDQLYWATFGIFFGANALLASNLLEHSSKEYVVPGTCGVGACFSVVWGMIQLRLSGYIRFYEAVVHNLENRIQIPADLCLSTQINQELAVKKMRGWSIQTLAVIIPWAITLIWAVFGIWAASWFQR